jgi:hypothetical protein
MYKLNQDRWFPRRESILASALPCFRLHYPDLGLILDCTEFFIEVASNHELQKVTWSASKHHNTESFGRISSAGKVAFVFDGYPDKISD